MFRVLALFILCCGLVSAGDITWRTDFAEATATAEKTQKPIVILFTGSDWCVWCLKAEKEIFDTPEFAAAAGDKFIFVKADFPLDKDMPLNLIAQNEKLKNQYGVKGFPTIVVVSPTGKALGSVGYSEGGGAKFAATLLKIAQGNA